MFSDHSEVKCGIKTKKFGKFTNRKITQRTIKITNGLKRKSQWNKKVLEMNENENKTYKKLWNAAKAGVNAYIKKKKDLKLTS